MQTVDCCQWGQLERDALLLCRLISGFPAEALLQ
jgi:hypothetical protein